MKHLARNLFLAGIAVTSAHAAAQAAPATYIGPDGGMWNVAANWSTGLIPDATTDVIVNIGTVVVPEGYNIELEDILITGITARIDKLPRGYWKTRNETITGGGQLLLHDTDATLGYEGTMMVGGDTGPGLATVNPTPKSKRIIVLQSSATLVMGLGGSAMSGPGNYGEGFYATLTGEALTLNGNLQIAQYFGFVPTVGQTFDIIKSTGRTTGQFTGLGEGDVAGNIGGVDLRISYHGGDGDDVVLTAVPEPMSFLVVGVGLAGLLVRRKRSQVR